MSLKPAIEITADGSATLRSPLHGDTYHSTRGARGEAEHVFIEAGFRQVAADTTADPVRILEMGFGTGLNAWLTFEMAMQHHRSVEYTAIELYPVPEDVTAQLGYTADSRFAAMHAAPWGEWAEPAERFRLRKLHGNAVEILGTGLSSQDGKHTDGPIDLVYWDAFAPDTQPELWTNDIFASVAALMAPRGILVTYSSKGDVKRALQSAGFTVERLAGALGKRHMLRATKL